LGPGCGITGMRIKVGSSVDIWTRVRTRRSGVRFPLGARDFHFFSKRPDRLLCELSVIHSEAGFRSTRVEGLGCEAEHSPPCRADV
jgi:hypothetical protein